MQVIIMKGTILLNRKIYRLLFDFRLNFTVYAKKVRYAIIDMFFDAVFTAGKML